MKLQILAFGVAQDLVGGRTVELRVGDSVNTVGLLKSELANKYPELAESVSYLIAVNSEYAHDDTRIKAGDEIAVIPPTSGG